MKHSFGSDNHSGVHPLIMEAIVKENTNFKVSYGQDTYTQGVLNKLEELLGGNCKALFVLNGTGANVVALAPFVRSFNAILAPATAHINVDECGSPDKLTGAKIVPLPHKNGKVSPDDVKSALIGFGDQHHIQPKILSISQPTELGTLYTKEEITELAETVHQHNCYLHIDGSRISNAAAFLNAPIKSFTADCGADSLSFGGTKNGLMIGEAVVIFNKEKNKEFIDILQYVRKQSAQLYSKNRFIAAQFERYLEDDLYLKMAASSNSMAQYLAEQLQQFPFVKISRPVESNAVFAILDPALTKKLQEKYYFYVWDEQTGEVRWMCSFNTQKEDIDEFINHIKKVTTIQ